MNRSQRDIQRALGPDWSRIGSNGRGHEVWLHRGGGRMITSKNLGCHRMLKNILATARKIVNGQK